ncbi:MAG: hypothetical protein L0Z62_39315 [Gemmataceae bacterium]|nr:hypothetical protein [Gemmataceae bacterium]
MLGWLWKRRFPELCQSCRTFAERVNEWRSRQEPDAAGPDHPHDFVAQHGELEQRGQRSYAPEGGAWLYHCRNCGNWWELLMSVFFRSDCQLRQVRVSSVEKWERR